jgi:DNA-binding XRE family transcriptional regulator
MRMARGQTMDELSALAGLSKAYLSRVESGERPPSLAALFALARAWDVDVTAIFRANGVSPVTRVRRTATVDWSGGPDGAGTIDVGSGTVSGAYSRQQRVDGNGVNTEEMIGAAHAGCFAMHLTHAAQRGRLRARAARHHGRGARGVHAERLPHRADRAEQGGPCDRVGAPAISGVRAARQSHLLDLVGVRRGGHRRARRAGRTVVPRYVAMLVDN